MNSNYTAESIQVLEGLAPVRKRPGMYIGSTDARGLHGVGVSVVNALSTKIIAALEKKSREIHSKLKVVVS